MYLSIEQERKYSIVIILVRLFAGSFDRSDISTVVHRVYFRNVSFTKTISLANFYVFLLKLQIVHNK